MKKNTFRILSLGSALVLALVAICLPEFAAEAVSFLFAGGAGSVMLGSQFAGASTFKGQNDLNPTLIARAVSKEVTTRRADHVPLDTIMRTIRKAEKTPSFTAEYLEHTYRPLEDAANGAVTGGGATDTLTVDNGNMWAEDDMIRVPSVNPSGGDELLLKVVSRSGNDLTVSAVNNGGTVPAIADNAVVYKTGNAKQELDAQTDPVNTHPVTLNNYCQIFMAQVEQSKYAQLANKVGGWAYQNYVDETIFNYKTDCASAHVFSPSKSIESDGTYITQGIYHTVQNTINFGSGGGTVDPSLQDIYDLGEAIYAAKNASDNKILLAGSKVMSGLALIDKYQRDLSSKDREIFHGVKVTSLTTPFGDIKVKYDPLMDKQGKSEEALILDLNHVFKHEFKALEAEPLDLRKSGVRNVVGAMKWDEASCLTLRYAGSSGVHAVWKKTA